MNEIYIVVPTKRRAPVWIEGRRGWPFTEGKHHAKDVEYHLNIRRPHRKYKAYRVEDVKSL